VSAVIKNENGTFEIRGWNIFDGWTYWDDRSGGYWWPEKFRRYSKKFTTPEQAIGQINKSLQPKPKDVKVWP